MVESQGEQALRWEGGLAPAILRKGGGNHLPHLKSYELNDDERD